MKYCLHCFSLDLETNLSQYNTNVCASSNCDNLSCTVQQNYSTLSLRDQTDRQTVRLTDQFRYRSFHFSTVDNE